jgi:hypothetical protein
MSKGKRRMKSHPKHQTEETFFRALYMLTADQMNAISSVQSALGILVPQTLNQLREAIKPKEFDPKEDDRIQKFERTIEKAQGQAGEIYRDALELLRIKTRF